jgi:hypothetical protein
LTNRRRQERIGKMSMPPYKKVGAEMGVFLRNSVHTQCNAMQSRPCFYSKNAVFNTPGGIRTPNLRFRRPTLYPIELQAQQILSLCSIVSCQRCCQLKYHPNSKKTGSAVILVSVLPGFCQYAAPLSCVQYGKSVHKAERCRVSFSQQVAPELQPFVINMIADTWPW